MRQSHVDTLTHLLCRINLQSHQPEEIFNPELNKNYPKRVEQPPFFPAGSDFSFAFNLAQTDETFQHARDPPVDGPASFLHEMNLYRRLQEEIPGVWEQLRPTTQHFKYQGQLPKGFMRGDSFFFFVMLVYHQANSSLSPFQTASKNLGVCKKLRYPR